MGDDIFDGISLEELAGSEDPTVTPATSGMSQGDNTQDAKNAAEIAAEKEKENAEDEDPDAIDINELAETGSVATEEEENDDTTTSSKAPTDNKGDQSPSSQSDATTSLASALADVGVFSSLTEEEVGEIKSAEDLVNAVRKQTEDNRYNDLTEQQKNYLDALKEGVPEREFHEHTTSVAQYKAVTDDQITGNTELTTELIRRSLVGKGVDNETAIEMAAIQAGKPDADARGIKARQVLISNEETKLKDKIDSQKATREAKVADEREALLTLKTKIQTATEILPGIKLNTQTRNKIFDSMTTTTEEKDGQQLNELMVKYQDDPDFRYKLHAMFTVTKGLTDFKKFKSAAKNSALEDLEQKLQRGNNTKTGATDAGGAGGHSAAQIAHSIPSTFGRS